MTQMASYNKYGTLNAATMPLGWRHYYILLTASLGQMIGCALATTAGVIIPLLNILTHPELSSLMQGMIGAADLVGIGIGSVIFGRLSDRYGYLRFFRLCPGLVTVASLVSIFVPNVWVLTLCLFICGLGIGGEYSLDGDYITDLMPQRYRSLMVGVAKMSSALGNVIAAALCLWIIMTHPDPARWPELMWIICGTSTLMLLLRIPFHESPQWLVSKGRITDAEKAVKGFLGKDVYIVPAANNTPAGQPKSTGYFRFIAANWRRVLLSGLPWACEGLGVYGFGVFLPILVMALGLEHFEPGMPEMLHVAQSVKVTLWISCIMVPGFILGLVMLYRKKKITRIQALGFWLCAISLLILMLAYHYHWAKWISLLAFMSFEFFLNMGPHLITYVLPPRIYPQADRGQGVGIAASIGKVGAVLGVLIIPVLLKAGGAMLVLGVSAAVMALGAIITSTVKIKA